GQIDRLGSRCAARAGGGCSAQCAHERSRVLLQGLAVDVRDSVARTVIAGIVWATGFAAEQLGLALRLLSGCAGIKAYGRDALLGERRVVGSKSATAALIERQVVRSEIGDDFVPYNRSQSFQGRGGGTNETGKIGRADHVKIDIERDLLALRLGQGGDVMARA